MQTFISSYERES